MIVAWNTFDPSGNPNGNGWGFYGTLTDTGDGSFTIEFELPAGRIYSYRDFAPSIQWLNTEPATPGAIGIAVHYQLPSATDPGYAYGMITVIGSIQDCMLRVEMVENLTVGAPYPRHPDE